VDQRKPAGLAILALLGNEAFQKGWEELIRESDWAEEKDPLGGGDVDFAVLDVHYFKTEVLHFLKALHPSVPVILIATEEEVGEGLVGPQSFLYDTLVIPRFGSGNAKKWIAEWLAGAKGQSLIQKCLQAK
jgi:hypothetical protein